MGNFASIHHQQPRPASIVLLYDGSTREFEHPPTVAELMLDHPRHVVAEFRSAVEGSRRPTALPADQTLEAKKLYVMLPMTNKLQGHGHRGNKLPPLSAEESRHFLSMANSALRSRPFNSKPKGAFMPVLSRVCADTDDHTGGGRRSSSLSGAVSLKEEEEEAAAAAAHAGGTHVRELREMMSENSNDMRMVMMSRQVSGKAWRPSLEAIMEKKVEVKPPTTCFNMGNDSKSN
ncbi:uncharacterized protein LOC115742569 [Rhodamnia argentea]|uniref:Uncharacterized protein LOC115742569 n=1 Tax=Rhodamnia argentea TaxID=178133 RepID=A0A8B8PFF0_9MYRT|nr:uncharacterized protein LOC115742569 [Rhodamnia argentea]